jgi:hypothetical protein
MSEAPWDFTGAQRLQFREAHGEAKRKEMAATALCQLDSYTEDDRYVYCTEPGAVDVEGVLMCLRHAGQLGYGPEQAEYGYDPDDGLNPTPEQEYRS